MCPESLNAIQGALGTVCEAVDAVISKSFDRAFVAIRPPGHHCGEDTPSGFCFVNNVAVAAAHGKRESRYAECITQLHQAHLKHGINRIAIFDIDLHHGECSASLIYALNLRVHRQWNTVDSVADQ